MGKNLKGKELGAGLSQRKDGKFSARYVDKSGKRNQSYFEKLSEAKRWLNEQLYMNEHATVAASTKMTVDTWFEYWIENIKGKTVRYNTKRNYKERYTHNIKEVIGDMIISEVKPMHCQLVMTNMHEDYKGSTQKQAIITMYGFFKSAYENDIIKKNPVTKAVQITKPVEKNTKVLTLDEQKKLIEVAKNSSNFNQYKFILSTGLRTGEMVGLKWSDLDFNKRTIQIHRTMEYRPSVGEWRVGEPKSESGYRTIPMTEEIHHMLKTMKADRKNEIVSMEFREFVFLNRNREPTKNSTYDAHLNKMCHKADIQIISMHTLRHTFATRCIESGMKPKTLQTILGHSSIKMTMDLYVHTTEEESKKEMLNFENAMKLA